MEVIPLDQLTKYNKNEAFFFIEEGNTIKYILAHSDSDSPNLLLKNLKKFGLIEKKAYLENHRIALICEIHFSQEKLYEFGIKLQEVKSFLTESISSDLQNAILRFHYWIHWDQSTLFCQQCKSALMQVANKTEKVCSGCSRPYFPHIAPAVMVLIQKDHEILLARSPHFKPNIYALIAGFIDIGETAEEAVHREVMEEVGLKITDLEYFGTQSWPFPNSFMIGFKAKYLSGEIKIDKTEIEHADWFDLNHLPEIPPYESISRKLIVDALKCNKILP